MVLQQYIHTHVRICKHFYKIKQIQIFHFFFELNFLKFNLKLRVKEVWNNADGTTIFDLKRSPCRVYPFELYLNLFLMCAWLCFYFLSLFYVLFVARAFSYFLFARACIIVMYI